MRQRSDTLLVLSAAGISYHVASMRGVTHIFVPPLLERLALTELASYAAENRPRRKWFPPLPLHRHWLLAPLYLTPLPVLHGMRHGFLASLNLADPARVQSSGCLDTVRVVYYGEWERAATALWLHVDSAHLGGNLFFGAVFLALLARLCGVGRAWLITFIGGVAGNVMSIFLHPPGYVSMGYSTAVFASVGAAAGLLLWRTAEKIFMPLAAAIGVLAMLGAQGANTDYGAHICGLAAGGALGIYEGLAIRRGWRQLPQFLAGLIALVLPFAAWYLAFAASAHW